MNWIKVLWLYSSRITYSSHLANEYFHNDMIIDFLNPPLPNRCIVQIIISECIVCPGAMPVWAISWHYLHTRRLQESARWSIFTEQFPCGSQKTGDGGCDALTDETRLTGMFASIISETDISVIIPFYETIEIIASLFIRLYCIQTWEHACLHSHTDIHTDMCVHM